MATGIGPQRIAVLLACTDRAATVGGVVDALHAALPSAVVHVYDAASTDGTAEVAARHGAVVRHEPTPGSAAAVRRGFADVDADVYLLLRADGSHDAAAAGRLVDALLAGPHDHVVAVHPDRADRGLDRAAGAALQGVLGRAVGAPVVDVLSGYRAVSRRFAASFPAPSRGLPVEVELAAHAARLGVTTVAVPVPDVELVGPAPRGEAPSPPSRPRLLPGALPGLLRLVRDERPLAAGAGLAAVAAALAAVPGAPPGLLPLAALLLAVGVVLDAGRRTGRDAVRLAYLGLPAPGARAVEPVDADGPEGLTDLVELVELSAPRARTPKPRTPTDAR